MVQFLEENIYMKTGTLEIHSENLLPIIKKWLYSEKDSLDLFHKKPIYFSSTNEDGLFKIDNVKKGRYSVYAFNDENKNFQAEFKKEKFGFVDSEVEVGESLEKIYIPLFNEDLTPLKLLRARERGSFVEVVLGFLLSGQCSDSCLGFFDASLDFFDVFFSGFA